MLYKNLFVFVKYRRIRAFVYYLFVCMCYVSKIKSVV